jgi:hypothetical protein
MVDVAAIKSERHTILFGRERVEVSLTFRDRKNLKITVHPDKGVTAEAPLGKPLDDVLSRLKKRAPWIIKQRDYYERFQPLQPSRRYVSGETHLYLGRQYRLKVVQSNDDEYVKLIGGYLYVHTTRKKDAQKNEELLWTWYTEHAKAIFERRLTACYETIKKTGVPYPAVRLRRMKKRWGSFSKNGAITLNTELVKAPRHCIDYVIIHELCHLKHKDHGKEFYRLLSRCMPDWEKRKARLEQVGI